MSTDTEYKGKQLFTIHANDAGSEAYRDEYVGWLEKRVNRECIWVWEEGYYWTACNH